MRVRFIRWCLSLWDIASGEVVRLFNYGVVSDGSLVCLRRRVSSKRAGLGCWRWFDRAATMRMVAIRFVPMPVDKNSNLLLGLMLLRFLLHQVVRQQAEKHLREAVSRKTAEAFEGHRHDTSSEEPLPCDILIFFASQVEAGGLLDRFPQDQYQGCSSFELYRGKWQQHHVGVAIHRAGSNDVAKTIDDVLRLETPSWLIAAGFSASLQEDIERGMQVLATDIVDEDGGVLKTGLEVDEERLSQHPKMRAGRVLTTKDVVRSASRRKELSQTSQGLVADLESMHAAQLCRQAKVKFLSARVVTEAFDEEFPKELQHLEQQDHWAGKLGATAGALFRRPSAAKDWWDLHQRGLQASDDLAKFLSGVVRQLP